jgi:hypothetical protein
MRKKRLFSALISGCLLIVGGGYTYSATENSQTPKIYVKGQLARISKHGILINVGEKRVVVTKLRSDEQGVYVLESDILIHKRRRSVDDTGAFCPACHTWCSNKYDMMNHTCYGHRHN